MKKPSGVQTPTQKGKTNQQTKKTQQPPKIIKPYKVDDYVRWDLPKQEVTQLKAAFDLLDTYGVGLVDPQQLRQAFLNLGFGGNGKYAYEKISRLQQTHPNGIDFDLFIHLASGKTSQDDSRQDIQEIFLAYDPQNKGSFGHNELKRVAHDLNQDIPDEEIDNIINKAAINEDGAITFEDFYNIMTHKVYWDK